MANWGNVQVDRICVTVRGNDKIRRVYSWAQHNGECHWPIWHATNNVPKLLQFRQYTETINYNGEARLSPTRSRLRIRPLPEYIPKVPSYISADTDSFFIPAETLDSANLFSSFYVCRK